MRLPESRNKGVLEGFSELDSNFIEARRNFSPQKNIKMAEQSLAYSSLCFSWNWFQLRTDSPYLELKAELGVLLPLLQLELVPSKN
jgi:hypothetical protein